MSKHSDINLVAKISIIFIRDRWQYFYLCRVCVQFIVVFNGIDVNKVLKTWFNFEIFNW